MREDQNAAAGRLRKPVLASTLLLIVICLATSSLTTSSPISAQVAVQGPTIKQEVRLVVLPVLVRDHAGHFVSGLNASSFRVYENGRLQQITLFRNQDVPVTVGLVIDHSGSMADRIQTVIDAAKAFVQSSNSQDREFVVNFAATVTFGLPAGVAFTNNLNELEAALSAPLASGRTALFDAVTVALNHFPGNSSDKKVLLLISDGGDNASLHSFKDVLRIAQASDVLIYCVGLLDPLSADQNPEVLTKLARATGGEVYFPSSSDEVVSDCRFIASDIRHQYSLGYTPSDLAYRGFRKIRVTVNAPGHGRLFIRTRAGYYLTPDSDNQQAEN